jgi:hypothetical protein
MPRVREVEFADCAAVAALVAAQGWDAPTRADWRHLWEHNPAAARGPRPCRGWVLEEGPRLLGYVCNLVQEFRLGGRTLRAASAGALIVRPEARGGSLQLVLPFARQPGVDLLLNTTCSPEASQIFQFLKFRRLPQPDYDRDLYWVLRPAGFLGAALRRRGCPAALGRAAGTLLAPLLWAEIRARGRRPRPPRGRALQTRVVAAPEIGADFDALWRRKLAEGRRLLACRDAATLRWHFAPRGRPVPPFLVAADDGAELAGYAAVTLQDTPRYRLRRAYLADLCAAGDDPETIRHLLAAAARAARARGAAMLQAVGFPEPIRRVLQEARPRVRRARAAWPYLYRALEADLHHELGSAALWHACLYDGDGSL